VNNSKKEKKKKNKAKMKEILNENNNYMDNLFIKKVKKITNKKNNKLNKNKYSQNYSSSYMKYQNIKPSGNLYNKIFDYKGNKSNNNSLSLNMNKLFIKLPKTLEDRDITRKIQTPKLKQTQIMLNSNKNQNNPNINSNNISVELSGFKKYPILQHLTSSQEKNTMNNNTCIRNLCFSKCKTKAKINNYSKNGKISYRIKSLNYSNFNSNGNIKKIDNKNNSPLFFKKGNNTKKQNKTLNHSKNNSGFNSLENTNIQNVKSKGYDMKLKKIINKIKNNKNIFDLLDTGEKKLEFKKKASKLKDKGRSKEKRLSFNITNKGKNQSTKLTDKQVKQIMKEANSIFPNNFKKLSEIYLNMKNFNQKSYTNRKKSSSSQENIHSNNNYNNFKSLNHIEKNININNININNKQINSSNKKCTNNNNANISNNFNGQAFYKKINSGYLSQRKENQLIDYIQLKMKIKLKSKPITTLQSREEKSNSRMDELSNLDIRKINSFIQYIPNSTGNSISPEGQLINTTKDVIETKNKKIYSNNNINFNLKYNQNKMKKINKKNLIKIINKNDNKSKKKTKINLNLNLKQKKIDKNSEKSKERIVINKILNVDNHKRNRDIDETNNNDINKKINSSFLTTIKDASFYLNEQKKLSEYIKKYHKEKGVYPSTQIDFYKYGRLLGKGAFGKVNLALHVASGKLVAIKSFNKSNLLTYHSKKKIKIEIEALSKLFNPFCTQIYDTFQTDTHILIVMEYVCADLLSFIRKRGKISENLAKFIFKQMIKGLKYIHKSNIVHRDIKLDNLLIDLSNTIKICDFGVSKILKKGDIMYEHCGTPAYIAPEIFEDKGYEGFSCDIWSAGITLYYILSGSLPFRGNDIEEIQSLIFKSKYDKIKDVSEEANDLISKMLKVNPKERISIDDILNHPWIKDVNIKNRKNINLFSKAEKHLLSKYNVCYLNSGPEELIENFTNQNLNTIDEIEEKGNTKSIILAPYNTYISDQDDSIYNDIEIKNDICKFKGQAQMSNIKYELSNNNEFDNGIIKTQNSVMVNLSEDIKNKSNIYNNELLNEMTDSINLSFDDKKCFSTITISDDILKEIEEKVGYDKKYLIQCLKNNEINYATATYYLMMKEKEKEK